MTKRKIQEMTSSYEGWLINSLKNKKEASAYLQAALDEHQGDSNIEALLLALRHVTEAQGGIRSLSQKTHLSRESLYKTLSEKGNPKLRTLGIVLNGLGYQLEIKAKQDDSCGAHRAI